MSACMWTLCLLLVVLSIAFVVAGYMAGRETKRMSHHGYRPHRRENRDKAT